MLYICTTAYECSSFYEMVLTSAAMKTDFKPGREGMREKLCQYQVALSIGTLCTNGNGMSYICSIQYGSPAYGY